MHNVSSNGGSKVGGCAERFFLKLRSGRVVGVTVRKSDSKTAHRRPFGRPGRLFLCVWSRQNLLEGKQMNLLAAWSTLNTVLVILAVIIVIVLIVTVSMRKGKEEGKPEESKPEEKTE